MKNKPAIQPVFFVLVFSVFLLAAGVSRVQANPLGGGQIPQIPAFLPISTDVPMTEKLPIDGEWMISTIRKRIRIEGGRAYALDPWLHLFVLKVEPLMVVIQDFQRTGPGQYTAYDLPLMGNLTATLQPDGSLKVSVAGALGPASYSLIPVRMDDQYSFDLEKRGQYVPGAGAPGYQPQPPGYPPPQTGYPVQPQPAPGYPVQPQPAPAPGNDLADCQTLDVDPATGNVVCMD